MATQRHWTDPELERKDEQRMGPFTKFVVIVVFAAVVFWLGESMVHHHFFTGGAMNWGNHPTGP